MCLILLPFYGGDPIATAAAQPPQPRPDRAFGIRDDAALHIAKHVPAEIEDADFAEIEAEIGEETDAEGEDADLADDLEDDPGDDLADEAEDHPDDDTDSDASVGYRITRCGRKEYRHSD